MTTNSTIISIPLAKFCIGEIVYIRESALNGYLEPQKVALAYFDPDIGKYWYSFKFKKNPPVTQTVGDIIDLKTKGQIQVLEDDLCSYQEALMLKRNFLNSELAKTITQIDSISGGPEIDIIGHGIDITNNDLTPNYNDYTNFGEQIVDINPDHGLMRTFEIKNIGNFDLNLLGNPPILLSGDNDFQVVSQPLLNVISSNSSQFFKIAFKPLSKGRKVASVIIHSNDKENSIFVFTIEGQGIEL